MIPKMIFFSIGENDRMHNQLIESHIDVNGNHVEMTDFKQKQHAFSEFSVELHCCYFIRTAILSARPFYLNNE